MLERRHVLIYMYIHIYRERGRYTDIYMYIYLENEVLKGRNVLSGHPVLLGVAHEVLHT